MNHIIPYLDRKDLLLRRIYRQFIREYLSLKVSDKINYFMRNSFCDTSINADICHYIYEEIPPSGEEGCIVVDILSHPQFNC